MNRPDNILVYDEMDLKLGIKSSLPHVKSTLALAILRNEGIRCRKIAEIVTDTKAARIAVLTVRNTVKSIKGRHRKWEKPSLTTYRWGGKMP